MKKYNYSVSVIVPIYNSEKYLNECIESVINQTHDFNDIELILVNSYSDKSLSLCKSYSEKYENIIVIDKRNGTICELKNAGIKAASGRYLMILDSNDMLSENTIDEVINFFEENGGLVDVVTFPIKYLNGKNGYFSNVYKEYNKGTNIYDVNEYIYLNQSKLNIVYKNDADLPLNFDEKMNVYCNQYFCIKLIMKKEKIGFISTTEYLYRLHDDIISDLSYNPYYCFDEMISYFEILIKKYPNSKYIQSLILNEFSWRLNYDLLFPYHLNKKEFDNEVSKIKKIINKIDIDLIMKNSNLKNDIKIFLLKFSEKKLKLNNLGKIVDDDKEVLDLNNLSGQIYRMNVKNNTLYLYGSFCLPLDNNKIKLHIRKQLKNNIIDSNVNIHAINLLHYNYGYNDDNLLSFEEKIDLKDLKNFELYIIIDKKEYKLNFEFGRFSAFDFDKNSFRVRYDFNNRRFNIFNSNIFTKISSYLCYDHFVLKHRPKACVYRLLSRFLCKYKNIWLYTDNCHALNNAFYQFKHDFNNSDDINKFYIYSSGIDVNKNFTEEEKKYLIRHGSLKHKMLFLNSKKIITSFSDLQVYCPFSNAIGYYKDITDYELIYLQHGILHASLKMMYLKRVTEIDKFVISSNFEKQNLIDNYNYSMDNLLQTGMPRMSDIKKNGKVKRDTILFAPSWRSYLIGNNVNMKRDLKKHDFINSSYFKNMYNFLHSKELKKYILDNKLKFVFKLHPNFYDYLDCFELDKLDYISLTDDGNYNKYCIFITDFSSFQFDFIKLYIPTIYFLPDEKEFRAGLHTYRDLDLKYEKAFGKLCKNDIELLNEMNRIKENKFVIESVYSKRIDDFFINVGNSQDNIYKYLINNK